MIKAVSTLIAEVPDVTASARFYTDVLGLAPEYLTPHWSSFVLGSVRIALHPPFRTDTVSGSGGCILGIEVEDIHTFRQHLLDHGTQNVTDLHEIPNGTVFDFTTPDGDPMQAVQYKPQ